MHRMPGTLYNACGEGEGAHTITLLGTPGIVAPGTHSYQPQGCDHMFVFVFRVHICVIGNVSVLGADSSFIQGDGCGAAYVAFLVPCLLWPCWLQLQLSCPLGGDQFEASVWPQWHCLW